MPATYEHEGHGVCKIAKEEYAKCI